MPQKFFLTTPIYYVNARPHIGHAYTTVVADVLARRHRLLGEDVFFLTGTDEHGQKIERSASAAGIPPQQFADGVSQSFRTLWDRMGITYTDFIRTTEPRHHRAVQKLFRTLQENGAIYLDSYTGAYCVSDEAFVDVPSGNPCPDCGRPTETVTEENYFFKLSQYQQPLLDLIESNTLTIEPESRRNEVLSFLRGGLRDLSISRSSFTWGIPVPGNEKHVVYVWLDALANYMTAVGYGDDSPEAQTSFAKYWPADLHIVGKEIIRFHCVYWPAFLLAAKLLLPKKVVAHGWLLFEDSKMSKSRGNIVRTETILDAFGTLCPPQPTPEAGAPGPGSPASAVARRGGDLASETWVSTHPNSPGAPSQTASSSEVGNNEANSYLDPVSLKGAASAPEVRSEAPTEPSKHDRDLFASDVLRYFLLREIPFGQDGSFSFDAMITRYNADLTNGYGNLVSRTLAMIKKYFAGVVPTVSPETRAKPLFPVGDHDIGRFGWDKGYPGEVTWIEDSYSDNLHTLKLSVALGGVSDRVSWTDQYINSAAPWKIKTAEFPGLLEEILYTAAESIRIITALLYPFLPFATASVWRQLGLESEYGPIAEAAEKGHLNNLQWGGLQPGTKLGPLSPIFPRADKGLAQIMTDMEASQAKPLAATTSATEFPVTSPDSEPGAPGPGSPESVLARRGGDLAPETWVQTDPAAGPRTATLPEPSPGALVAGSAALTTERPGTPPHTEAQPSGIFAHQPTDASPQITVDDFAKIELRIAKILVAERIPKADKLLRLEVDLGYEKRQILSGIAEWYTPEDLIGRRIVVIANLAPRKMRGLESHGMLLAASAPPDAEGKPGKPALATFADTDVFPLGARLK